MLQYLRGKESSRLGKEKDAVGTMTELSQRRDVLGGDGDIHRSRGEMTTGKSGEALTTSSLK